jgi:hypothetical protein
MRFGFGGDTVHHCEQDATQDKGHVEGHLPQEHFGIAFSRIIWILIGGYAKAF